MARYLLKPKAVFVDPPGELVPNTVVGVENDKIAFVGSEREARSAFGTECEVLSLPELLLFPGLMNTHVHLSFDCTAEARVNFLQEDPGTRVVRAVLNAQALLKSGVTTARDCGSDFAVLAGILGVQAKRLVPLPNLIMCGPPITQTGGHLHFMGGEVDNCDGIRHFVRRLHKRGARSIKVMATGGQMTPGTLPEYPAFTQEELRTVVETSRDLGLPTVSHCLSTEGTLRSARAGFDSIEHCAFFEREARGWLERVYRQEVTDAILANGSAVMTGLSANHHGLDRARASGEGSDREHFLLQQEQRMFEIFKSMFDQGVSMIVGTDAGVINTPFDETYLELVLMVKAGLPPVEAVRGATTRAAKAMRIDHLTGAIRVGLRADLIGVADDPLLSPDAFETVDWVMVAGALAAQNGKLIEQEQRPC